MPTASYTINNGTGLAVRTAINSTLAAIQSLNANSSAPADTAAFMLWADTSTNTLKIRNAADNAFIELMQLDGTMTMEDGSASAPGLAFRDDLNTGIFSSAADTFNVATGGVERMELGATTIFNESGADVDFRIEGDSVVNMFYVDAGNNRIGFGTDSPTSFIHAVTTDTTVARFATTSTGGTGAEILLFHASTSPADNDNIGAIYFQGNHDGGSAHTYGNILFTATDVSDGSEDANFTVSTSTGGVSNQKLRLNDEGILLSNLGSGGGLAVDVTAGGASSKFCQIGFNAHRTGDFDLLAGINASWNSDSVANITFLAGTDTSNKDNGKLGFATQFNNAGGLVNRMLINEDGQVLIGGTSNAGAPGTNERFIVFGNANNNSRIAVVGQHNDDNPASFVVAKSRGTGNTILGTNDDVGQLDFEGNDGNGFHKMARILCSCSGAGNGSDNLPGDLRFFTLPASSTALQERMRIKNNGHFAFNSGGTVNATYQFNYDAATGGAIFNTDDAFSGNATAVQFRANGQVGGSIVLTNNGTTTAYATSSDYRLKENAVAISDGITRLKTLKPYRFNFKSSPSRTVDGFFAHEVTAVPEAITGTKDKVDSDNNPVYQGIDQSKLVPLLVAAVQELIGKVEALEAA